MNAGGFSTDRAQWPSPTYRCPGLLGTFREQSGLTYAQLPRRWPWLEVLVGLSVAVAVWIVARGTSFPYQPVVEVKVAKNRVQPANSLQAKCSVSWVMTGGELVAVPIFPSCTTFATGCYALAGSLAGGVLVSYPPICRTMPYCFRPA